MLTIPRRLNCSFLPFHPRPIVKVFYFQVSQQTIVDFEHIIFINGPTHHWDPNPISQSVSQIWIFIFIHQNRIYLILLTCRARPVNYRPRRARINWSPGTHEDARLGILQIGLKNSQDGSHDQWAWYVSTYTTYIHTYTPACTQPALISSLQARLRSLFPNNEKIRNLVSSSITVAWIE